MCVYLSLHVSVVLCYQLSQLKFVFIIKKQS